MDSQVAGNESKFTASRATVGGRRHGVSVKTLKKVLKKAGLKTTGKKATLTRRAKKARLMGGTVTGALKSATETGKAAVGTLGEVANIPVKGLKGALNGSGKSRRGGKYY